MRIWTDSAFFVREQNEEAKQWMLNHGVDPVDVPLTGHIWRPDPQSYLVCLEVFDRDDQGNLVWDNTEDGHARPRIKTITLDEFPPLHLTQEV